ncbi:molybdate ABC transporter substrate-binding protein [Nitrospira sp.]|nr:molybdate ABC transporter substrate-binding protein [Nitrospira sp.]
MLKMLKSLIGLGLVLAFAFGTFGQMAVAEAADLTVGAPPSLRPTFAEILPLFEREYGVSVQVVYTPSGTLSRQVENGTAIDVFLGAGMAEVERLHRKGLTLDGRPRVYAQTSLVLVMSTDSPGILVSFDDALPNRATRIAMGDPRVSSLGSITAQALTKVHPRYKDRSHLLYAPHSEDIMQLIHKGKADVGLVYRIDAISSTKIRISDESPIGEYLPVQFGHAIVSTCRESSLSAAHAFSEFLMSSRIQKLLLKYGFEPIPASTQSLVSQRN